MSGLFLFGPAAVWPGVAKAVEEMGELQQQLGKLVMVQGHDALHWSGPLRPKIWEEVADVCASMQFLLEHNASAAELLYVNDRVAAKLDKFRRWHATGEKLVGETKQ